MITFTVTTLADSGTGSLRQAILDANACTGDEEIRIVFDSSLTGKTIVLESMLYVNRKMSITCSADAPVTLTGSSIVSTAKLELINMTLPQILLSGEHAALSGSGNKTTQQGAFLMLQEFAGDAGAALAVFDDSVFREGQYVSVNSIKEGADAVFSVPEDYAGKILYKVNDEFESYRSLWVSAGASLTLKPGVLFDISERGLYFSDAKKFSSEGAEIFSSYEYGYVSAYSYEENSVFELKDTKISVASTDVYTGHAVIERCEIIADYLSLNNAAVSDCTITAEYCFLYGESGTFDGVVLNGDLDIYLWNSEPVLRHSTFNGAVLLYGGCTIEDCDLTNTSFDLEYLPSEAVVEFNGCTWGTDDIAQIFARFGQYAKMVNIDGQDISQFEDGLVVSNTNASGEGSLSRALALLTILEGDAEIHFAAELDGAVLTLDNKQLNLAKKLILVNDGTKNVTLEGLCITTSADLHIEGITLDAVSLSQGVKLSGSGIELSGSGAVLTLSDLSADLSEFSAVATQRGAYISVTDSYLDSSAELAPCIEGASAYRLENNLRIQRGATLSVKEGVELQLIHAENAIVVENGGNLVVEDSTLMLLGEQLITTRQLVVQNGGSLVLRNASVLDEKPVLPPGSDTVDSSSVAFAGNRSFTLPESITAANGGVSVAVNLNLATLRSIFSGAAGAGRYQLLDISGARGSSVMTMGTAVDITLDADGNVSSALVATSQANTSAIETPYNITDLHTLDWSAVASARMIMAAGEQPATIWLELTNNDGSVLTLSQSASGMQYRGWVAQEIILGEAVDSGFVYDTFVTDAAASAILPEMQQSADSGSAMRGITAESGSSVTIENSSLTGLNSAGTLSLEGSIISDTLVLSGGTVAGSGNVFTGEGRVIQLSNAEANLSNLQASATQAGAYISVTDGYLTSSNAYNLLGEGLNTYRFENGLHVYNNANLVLGAGVVLDFLNYNGDFWIERGSSLVATGATLNLIGHSSDAGGNLSNLRVEGVVTLTDCTINGYAATSCHSDSETIRVSGNGNLTLSNCELNDVNYFDVESGGTATISNTTLQNLTNRGTVTLENASLDYLTLHGGKVSGIATLNGSGRVITMASAEANISDLAATATQDATYIGVTDGTLTSSNAYNVLGEGLDTYRFENGLDVYNNANLVLGAGVVLDFLNYNGDFWIERGSSLVATGATLNLIGHSSDAGGNLSNLRVEGVVTLTDCTINGYAATSCHSDSETIRVSGNGNLTLSNCELNDVNYFDVESGGVLNMSNISLNNLSSGGSVEMDNVFLNYLTLNGGKVSGTVNLTGSGRVINLTGAETDMTELSASATQEGAYIGVTDGYLDSGSGTFLVLGEGLDTYRLETSLRVYNGKVLTLGEGVVLESLHQDRDITVYGGGKLVATGATLNLYGHSRDDGNALSELRISGTVELTDCTINAYAATYCNGDENICVQNRGVLRMTDCRLNDVNYFAVESGGTATISNTSLQNLTSSGTLTMSACALKSLSSSGTTNLDAVTAEYLTLGGGKVSGTVNLTGSGRVINLTGAETDMTELSASATQEGAYIGVTDGYLDSGSGTFLVLGEGLDTYRLETSLRVYNGKVLTLGEGVVLESLHQDRDITVYGGGKLVATGATLNLYGHSRDDGNALSELRISGTVELTDCTINAYAATYCNGYENICVSNGGVLSMADCRLNDVNYFEVESGGTATISNTTLQNLSNAGTLVLENSTLSGALTLSGGRVSGAGNILTGAGCVMVLQSFSADLSGFAATATQEGAYVQVNNGSVNSSSSLRVLGEGLDTYRLNTSISVYDGNTFTLGEGVTLVADRSASHDINVNGGGKFIADGATLQLLGASSGDRVNVRAYNGAEVCLRNTVVQGAETTASKDSTGNFYVASGGRLEMENTHLEGVEGINVGSGGTFEAHGLSGDSWVTLHAGAAVTIQNSDVSALGITVKGGTAGGNKIDLSGNYWGTTNYEEILAKISGYNADYVVLENWLVTAPENAVAIEGLVGDKLLDASENSVTLRFSEEMDATTTTVDKFSIVNELGEVVEITGFELNGCDVVLEFGQLPKDGTYRVSVANGLQSATGKSVQVYMSRNGASEYSETLRADVTPETVTAVSLQKSTQPRYVDVVFSGAVNPATAAVGLFVLRGPAGETVEVQSISTPGANTLRLRLPAFSAVGEYTLEMLPGITDYAGNAVVLPEEPLSFTLESADVSVTAADVAYTGHTYGSVQVALTANNAGNVAATAAKVEIWLTKNGSIASDSILLDIVTVDLAAGEQKELTRTLLLEQAWDLAEGEYQLVTRSSWGDELSALRADNTAAIGTLSVSYPPAADLSITAITLPEFLEPGQSFALQLQVANNGGQPTPAEGLVELGLIQSGADASTMISLGTYTLVASTTGAELAPGESLLLSVPAVQLPAGIQLQGDVQLVAVINPDNDVFEKPEHRADNTCVAEQVLQLEPTLSLSLSRSEVTEGSGLRVVYTITRSGDCSEALAVQVDCALAARLGLPETLTIAAGQSSLRYQAAPVNDQEYLGNASAEIAISAAGYKGAQSTISLVEDEKPTLTLTLSASSAAEGAEITGTVSMNTISTVDTVVKLGSTYAAQLNLPASVTIKAGESSASFTATVVQDETAEIDKELKITAAATGFNSGTAKVTVVDDDIPQVELLLDKQLVSESDGVYAIIGTLKRTSGSSEPISVRLFDADGIGLLLPDTVRLAEGQTSMKFNIGIVDDNSANGSRSGAIRGEIILDSCGCDASSSPGGTFTSQPITITDNDSPSLRVSLSKTMIREGGGDEIVITVSTNHLSENDIVVNLSDNGFLELPSSIVISAGDSFATCVVRAKSDVVDSGTQTCLIAAESDGFQKGMGYAQVTDIDLPDLVVRSISVPDAAVAGQNIKVGMVIANQGYAVAYSGAGVDIKLSNGTSLGCVATDRDIDAGESIFVETELTLPDYAGAFHVIAEIDTSGRVTELNENNNISTSSYVLNVVSGFEVTAQITESEMTSSGGPAHINGVLSAGVDGVSVGGQVVTLDVFLNGSYVRSSQVVTADDGSFSQVLEIPARVPGTYSIKARVMGETSDVLDSLVVSGMKCASPASNLAWLIEKDSSVTGKLSIKNIGAVDLHNVSLILNNLPDNIQITNVSAAQDIAVGKTVDFTFTIAGNSVNVGDLYSLIPIEVVCDEGEKLSVNAYSYVVTPLCDLSLSVNELHVDVNHEYARYIELTVTNYGNGDSGRVSLSLPDEEWLSLYSGNQIENLKCGESATIVLKVDASSANVLLGAPYKGSIVVNAENGSSQVLRLGINFVDSQKCSLKVNLKDTFGLQIGESVGLADTKVYLYDAYTQRLVASAQSNERGEVYFGDLEAGKYYLNVDNEVYDFYQTNISLEPGQNLVHEAYLSASTVKYTFTVLPVEIEDKYEIVHTVDFTTNVPAPVVVFEDSVIQIPDIGYGETVIVPFTVSNLGYVSARGYELLLPELSDLTLTILNPITELPALSSYEFFLQVTAPEKSESGDKSGLGTAIQQGYNLYRCLTGWGIQRWFDCSDDGRLHQVVTLVQTNQENCDALNSSNSGSVFQFGFSYLDGSHSPSGDYDAGRPSHANKGGSGQVSTFTPPSPIEASENACSPCLALALNICRIIGENRKAISDLRDAINKAKKKTATKDDYKDLVDNLRDIIESLEEEIDRLSDQLRRCYESLKNKGTTRSVESEAQWLSLAIDLADYSLGELSRVYRAEGLRIWQDRDLEQLMRELSQNIQQNEESPDQVNAIVSEFIEVYEDATGVTCQYREEADLSIFSMKITEEFVTKLLSTQFGIIVGEEKLMQIVERWNRTVSYHEQGIYSEIDLPEGNNTDFYSTEYLADVFSEAAALYAELADKGYEDSASYLNHLVLDVEESVNGGAGDVCASVKIQFRQTSVMTREAFDGLLTLENGSALGDLTNIRFSVYVLDEHGTDVTDLFNISYYDLEGIDSLDGGVLASGAEGQVKIRYIPGRDVAPEASALFRFGANLSYNDPGTGLERSIVVTPVELNVNPSPSLDLHYFLSENSYSDDPYTTTLESVQKSELGLIVKNSGNGIARNFRMSDFHPTILENETGLAIELTMMGASLNGGELQKGGTVLDFGNIAANSTSTAIWYFSSNLHGYFSNYQATFTRVDMMGNEVYITNGTDVSLIENVNTHMLTRSMNVDGDEKTDFLVNDVQDALDLADGIYFGDGSYADVHAVTGILSSTGQLGGGVNTISLTMRASAGWNYFRIDDPGMGDYCITGVTVGGVALDSSAFWQTDRIFAADGTATYVSRLHWVYEAVEDGDVEVVLDYKPADADIPKVVSISGVENGKVVRELPAEISVKFSEAVNPGTFNVGCVELRKGTERLDLAGLTWTWTSGDTLVFTNLHEFMTEDAVYSLAVRNTNVQDIYGNPGDGTGEQVRWTLAGTAFALEGVSGHEQRRENSYVDTLYVTFTTPVAEFNAEAITLYVTEANGVTYPINGAGKLMVTQTDTEGKIFAITGLESLQVRDGSYSMSIDRSKVLDIYGQACLETSPISWNLHKTPPTVLDASFDEAEQLVQNIDTINLQFSHAVSRVDSSAIIIRCNGEVYTSDSLVCEVHPDDPTLVIVRGISSARPQGKAAAMPDGDWQMEVDMTGVEDIYGNLGEGTYSADWEVDTVAPAELESITINGGDSCVVAESSITVGAELPEAGLTVSIYDRLVTASGMGTLLWTGVVEGTVLSRQVTLLNGSSHAVSIVTTDSAGNETTNSFNVLVDMVVLTAAMDLEDQYKDMPDAVSITFSSATTDLPLAALKLTVDGREASLDGATLTRVSETEWQLSGLGGLSIPAGEVALSVDLSTVSKTSSGLQGQGVYTQSFTYDPVAEVRVAGCDITTGAGSVTGISISFSTNINYAELKKAGVLGDAVRLVNQTTGSVVELAADGFAYAGNTLTWSGEQKLPGGSYALVIDPALLTAANGSPLVGNEGTADTAIVSYVGDAVLLGAAGSSYSAPYAVDWNADGHTDLLVGEKVGSEGKVRLYLNDGNGRFSDYTYLRSNGADLSVAASGCQGIVVALQDITGDGIADLVAGLSNGSVQYFSGMADGSFGTAAELLGSSVAGSRAYPTFHDWNADGVTDLVLGTGSGSLMVGLCSQDAATGALSFATPTTIAGIEVPGRAAPVFADVNGDTVDDLILGAGDGSLTLYYGTESGYHKVASWQLDGISWERSRVTLADLNADGTADLVVGGSTGAVYVVYGAAASGTWSEDFEVVSGAVISSTAAAVEGKNATLSWVVDYAETGLTYIVEVADNADFANATSQEVNATTLTMNGLSDGNFFWRVSIKDSAKPAVTGQGFTVDTVAPGAPAELAATVNNGSVLFCWAAVTDASGVKYELRFSSAADFAGATVVPSNEAGLNLSLPVGEWYWQVRAVDGAGNAGAWATAAESLSVDEYVIPEPTADCHWAQGLVTSGSTLLSGYWDADKSGTGDRQLCWAAADANMLAWWQQQYGVTDFSSSDVPESADDIFAVFKQNWANVSGREEFGLTWWISGASENGSYGTFYADNYTGSGEQGAYYAAHYDAAATSALVKEVSLTGADAEQLARDWAAVYAAGGIISLGVYSSLSGSTLVGGHALTVWGFATDSAGRLSSITVTDSDDGVDAAVTLSLAYNVTKGYYQIAQSGTPLNGRLLGDYTSLAAFDKQDAENNTETGAEVITMSEPENGSSTSTSSHYNWVGSGDVQDYYAFTAVENGSYKVSIESADIESNLWLSVGTWENGEFDVMQRLRITPNASIYALDRINLQKGETYYVRVTAEDETEGTWYELSVAGDLQEEKSLITDNNTRESATRLEMTGTDDASIDGWVGAGDAVDFYRLEMTEAGKLSISLSELETNAKVKVYQVRGNERYTQKMSATASVSSGLDRTLSLTAGSYLIEIASYDNGAGRYNSTYALELEKEEDGDMSRYVIANA